MIEDKEKEAMFDKLLQDIMNDMGSSDAMDRFAPKPKPEDIESVMPGENPLGHDMSPMEGQDDDGETPHDPTEMPDGKGLSVEKVSVIPAEDIDDEDDDKDSLFSRGYFKRK